eukprot:754732-Amphidinium_carterae.1
MSAIEVRSRAERGQSSPSSPKEDWKESLLAMKILLDSGFQIAASQKGLYTCTPRRRKSRP